MKIFICNMKIFICNMKILICSMYVLLELLARGIWVKFREREKDRHTRDTSRTDIGIDMRSFTNLGRERERRNVKL